MIVLKQLYYRVNGMPVPQRAGSSSSLASEVELEKHWLCLAACMSFFGWPCDHDEVESDPGADLDALNDEEPFLVESASEDEASWNIIACQLSSSICLE